MYPPAEFSVKDLDKYLTKSEILDLLQMLYIAHTSRNRVNEDEFKKLVLGLKKVVPFDCFMCGYATTNKEALHSVNVDYPLDYLDRYCENHYEQIDPVIKVLMEERKVVNWKDVDEIYDKPPESIVNQEAKAFGLLDGFAYGVYDGDKIVTFWFAGRHIERNERSLAVIEFAARSLFYPLKELYEKAKQNNKQSILSKREIEVLNWLKEGKSSWDISRILQISERTVNFHVNNIIEKLNAMNRTQAVSIAIAEQIIDV